MTDLEKKYLEALAHEPVGTLLFVVGGAVLRKVTATGWRRHMDHADLNIPERLIAAAMFNHWQDGWVTM